jgi:hypothetical protein
LPDVEWPLFLGDRTTWIGCCFGKRAEATALSTTISRWPIFGGTVALPYPEWVVLKSDILMCLQVARELVVYPNYLLEAEGRDEGAIDVGNGR